MAKLTAKDVCDIIKACADHRVGELQFESLHLKMDDYARALDQASMSSTVQEQTKIQETALRMDEARFKQDQLAHMLIEDPAAADRLLAEQAKEFEDDGTSDESG